MNLEQKLKQAGELIGELYNRRNEEHKEMIRKGLLKKKFGEESRYKILLGKGPIMLILELYEKTDVVYVIKCSTGSCTSPVQSLLSTYEISHSKHNSFLIAEPFDHRAINLFGRKYAITTYGGIKKKEFIEKLNKPYDKIDDVLDEFLKKTPSKQIS